MLPDSFSLRRAAIAYLFRAQPELSRQQAFDFYDSVTDQGVELPQFNHQGNAVQLVRQTSGDQQNSFEIEVGQHESGAFRLLVAEEWPRRTVEVIGQDADIAWNCFRQHWPEERIGRTAVLVECSLRSTVDTQGGNATQFLAEQVYNIPSSAFRKLGRDPHGLGLKLMLPVQLSGGSGMSSIPLNGAGGDIRVETLQDDPSKLYIETRVRWPSGSLPPDVRQQEGAPPEINPETHHPSVYLDQVNDFMKTELTQFLLTAAGDK